MRFAWKITILLFSVIVIFVLLNSFYLYSLLNENFARQADAALSQTAALMEQRIETIRDQLDMEMQQLASSLFTENENTLAAILRSPPQFNAAVIGFAGRLKSRTTLDFLTLLNADGIVISQTLQPAAFGKIDPHADSPVGRPFYFLRDAATIELRKKIVFGRHTMYLQGGYFLREDLAKLQTDSLSFSFIESAAAGTIPQFDSSYLVRTIELKADNGETVLQIAIAVSKRPLEVQKNRLITNSLYFAGGALLVCALLGLLLSHSITRPIGRLREAAEQMSSGDLDVRVIEESGDFAVLTSAFNRMAADLQENQQKLLQAERIAAWREIARHLAHEIKNPLVPIRTSITNLKLCQEKAPEKFNDVFRESTDSILEEVERLRHLADEFSRFAKLPPPNLKLADLNDNIAKAIQLYGNGDGARGTYVYGEANKTITIHFSAGDVPHFAFDQEQLSEVIHNLLQNAIDSIANEGTIQIATETIGANNQKWVVLTLQDNGKGMDQNLRLNAFVPYYSTKQKGTGLGLAIVQRIVSEHRGTIQLRSQPGEGSRFEIRFPVSQP